MRGGENSLDKKVRKEMGLSWPLYHILLEVREEIDGQYSGKTGNKWL
jgi:hypothetical protein